MGGTARSLPALPEQHSHRASRRKDHQPPIPHPMFLPVLAALSLSPSSMPAPSAPPNPPRRARPIPRRSPLVNRRCVAKQPRVSEPCRQQDFRACRRIARRMPPASGIPLCTAQRQEERRNSGPSEMLYLSRCPCYFFPPSVSTTSLSLPLPSSPSSLDPSSSPFSPLGFPREWSNRCILGSTRRY